MGKEKRYDIKINGNSVIAPKGINIDGIHKVKPDDRFIFKVSSGMTCKEIEDFKSVLANFFDNPDERFLIITGSAHSIVILEKDL